MKRVTQRLTVGACAAIKMHSKTDDKKQLCHDVRNSPNHMLGDLHTCNPAFCKVALNVTDDSSDCVVGSDTDSGNSCNSPNMEQSLTQQLEDIIKSTLDDEPTATDKHDA